MLLVVCKFVLLISFRAQQNVTFKLNEIVTSEDVPILTMDDLSPDNYSQQEDNFYDQHASRKQPSALRRGGGSEHTSASIRKDLSKEMSRSRSDFEHTSFYAASDRRDGYHSAENSLSLEQVLCYILFLSL